MAVSRKLKQLSLATIYPVQDLTVFTILAMLMFAAAASAAPAVQPGTLCQTGERVIFSCPVKNATRLVSICGSKALTDKRGYLQYRFGRAGKIELAFPEEPQGSQHMFRYAHYIRPQVDRFSVGFTIDGHTYEVFKNYEGDSEPKIHEAGIFITLPDGKNVEILCVGPEKGNLHEIKSVVPCDPDNALNLGECP